MVDAKRFRLLGTRGLIVAVAFAPAFVSTTAYAQSQLGRALSETAQPSQVVLVGGGYGYKTKTNWGAVGAAGVAGFVIGNALAQRQRSERSPSKKSYSSKPKQKKKPEPQQARIRCAGGEIEDGECVCPDGAERKTLGKRSFSCEIQNADYAPDEIVVTLDTSSSESLEQEVAKDLKLDVSDRYVNSLLGERIVKFKIKDGRSVESVLSKVRSDGRVNEAQLNYYYRQQAGGDTASEGQRPQYALSKINLNDAQALSRGRGVLIALIDGYVDSRNSALQSTLTGLRDATDDKDSNPDSHATAIAGIMNANGDIRGIAPEARILSIRAIKKSNGLADTHTIGRSLDIALQQNARVLLLPLISRHDPMAERLIKRASLKQMVIIAPAGNNGPDAGPAYPAAYSDVIAVTATDSEDQLYNQANLGSYVAVSAPGVNVMVLSKSGDYDLKSGTSYAAAHVAGVAALMLGLDPQLPLEQVRRAISESATDLGEPGKDKKFGAGRINAAGALHLLKSGAVPTASAPVATPPPVSVAASPQLPPPQAGQPQGIWQNGQYYVLIPQPAPQPAPGPAQPASAPQYQTAPTYYVPAPPSAAQQPQGQAYNAPTYAPQSPPAPVGQQGYDRPPSASGVGVAPAGTTQSGPSSIGTASISGN